MWLIWWSDWHWVADVRAAKCFESAFLDRMV